MNHSISTTEPPSRSAPAGLLDRRITLLAAVAIGLAVLVRVPFWDAPLTADEGGYAEVARLWSHGAGLYSDIWVDRPQGLLLLFRGVGLIGASPLAMRAAAALLAALVVGATMLLASRLSGDRRTGVVAGLLAATIGASPFIESFTLSGELAASLPAVLSLLCFCAYLRGGRLRWLVAAGLLTGAAVLVKQSAFDAGLAAVAFLLLRRGRHGLAPAATLVAAALVPVSVAALSAGGLGDWLYAVVGYRFDGDSLLTGSIAGRLHMFWVVLPAVAKGLGILAALAAVGWRGSPLLARLWLAAALIGVLGGGNFHPHYFIQLVPPLSLLAALGLRRVWEAAPRTAFSAAAAAAAGALVLALPLALSRPAVQARAIWPLDHGLAANSDLARYVRDHTEPGQRILVLWSDASVYYLANRRPAVPYLWKRNVAAVPGALARFHDALEDRNPALVLVAQSLRGLDPSGRSAALLARGYRFAAQVGHDSVFLKRPAGRL